MFIPGGAGLARAESVAQNHFGSTRPSVPGRSFARSHLNDIHWLNPTELLVRLPVGDTRRWFVPVRREN